MPKFIDLKRMRYMVAIAEAESVTAASQTLNLSQPALTRNIAEVEDELGIQLFYRLPRGISMTEHGSHFIREAKRILGEVEDLVEELSGERGKLSGRLRIGLISDGYVSYVQGSIERIIRDHPDIGLEFTSGSAAEICPRLLNGEFHMVLGSSSYLERWRGLQVERLSPLRFTIMVRSDHPLTASRQLSEQQVLQYPLVLIQGVDLTHADIGQRYNSHDLEMSPRYVAYDWEMAKRLVLSSDAFFPLYYRPVAGGVIDERFAYLPNVVAMPERYISLAFAEHNARTPLAQLFSTLLSEELVPSAKPVEGQMVQFENSLY